LKKINVMKKGYILIIFLLGVIISLSIGKAIMQNTLSTSGIYVGEVQEQINEYETQNTILSEQLLTASSLTNIMEKAEASGFTRENTLMVLNASRPLAIKP